MGSPQSKLKLSHVDLRTEERPVRFNNVSDCLKHFAHTIPDKDAVVFASTDGTREAVTFQELYDKSQRAARALVNLGVRRHEFVSINVRPCPEWLYMTFGAMMAGARSFGLSFTYKDGSDLIGMMKKLETCSCLILDPGYDDENWKILEPLLDSISKDGTVKSSRMPSLRYLIGHKPCEAMKDVKTFSELFDGAADLVNELPVIDQDDIATLYQTSGSTGFPKAVIATHKAFMNNLNYNSCDIYSAEYIYYCDRPFNWSGGFPFNVFLGQTRVTMSGFCPPPKDKAKFVIDVIKQEKCQILFSLPPALDDISKKLVRDDDWPLKTLVIGGQPITKATVEKCLPICQYMLIAYGGTEFQLVSMCLVEDIDAYEEYCCGYQMPGCEVKIVDENGEIVPPNTRGEIYIRRTRQFTGYYNDPEKTKSVFTDDGWYKTDDIGRMMDDGKFFVEGRKSNMIISGGMNVFPEILETLLRSCPGVETAILVPVSDALKYQVICACVTLLPGSDLTEEKLREFCINAHGDSQGLFVVLPKYYMILDSNPETMSGKVSRRELTSLAEKRFGQTEL